MIKSEINTDQQGRSKMDMMKDIKFSQKMDDKKEYEPYKTIWRRILASVIDGAIFLFVHSMIGIISHMRIGQNGYVVTSLISPIFPILYNIVMVKLYGGSIGKLLSKVAVLDEKTEGHVSLIQSISRELLPIFNYILQGWRMMLYISVAGIFNYAQYKEMKYSNIFIAFLGLIIIVLGYIEIFSALFSKKRRAIHDYIAGTVVKKNGKVRKILILISILSLVVSMKISGYMMKLYV